MRLSRPIGTSLHAVTWLKSAAVAAYEWHQRSHQAARSSSYTDKFMEQFHGTTILSARRGSLVALGGDGQVTLRQRGRQGFGSKSPAPFSKQDSGWLRRRYR